MQENKKLNAFTMAEVLITLVIIGVIAMLTIPSLIHSFKDAQYVTTWKKNYSILSQAMTNALSDNAGNISSYFYESSSDAYSLKNLFKKYLISIQDCNGNVFTNCFPQNYINQANGTQVTQGLYNDGGLILNNGAQILFNNNNGETPPHSIFVDVNGSKGPNQLGKDQYVILVYPTKLDPAGSQGDSYVNTCSTTGWGCSADFLMNK